MSRPEHTMPPFACNAIPPTPRRFGTTVSMVPSTRRRYTPPPSTSENSSEPSVSIVGPSTSPKPDASTSHSIYVCDSMPRVLGVDSSTQATKVEVRDADTGALIAEGRAPHPPTTPPRSEQHPDAWWHALAEARAGLPAVDAIAVAGQQHGLVVLDTNGAVVRPAKLWNDTESAPDAQWLRKQLDDEQWARACGSVPLAAFTIAKLSWLHRSEPDAWARLARVCLPHDWLTYKLTGAFVTDRGDASGTGYFSAAEDAYRGDLL